MVRLADTKRQTEDDPRTHTRDDIVGRLVSCQIDARPIILHITPLRGTSRNSRRRLHVDRLLPQNKFLDLPR